MVAIFHAKGEHEDEEDLEAAASESCSGVLGSDPASDLETGEGYLGDEVVHAHSSEPPRIAIATPLAEKHLGEEPKTKATRNPKEKRERKKLKQQEADMQWRMERDGRKENEDAKKEFENDLMQWRWQQCEGSQIRALTM